jgi:hypothetical protein
VIGLKPVINAFTIAFGDRFPVAETYSPKRRNTAGGIEARSSATNAKQTGLTV